AQRAQGVQAVHALHVQVQQERGQTLGSQLRFEARAPHGTRVLFSFVPTALQPSAAKEPTP
ncbi:hypothetical protein C0044_28825, partial [Pseudomonas aeruginosa]